MNICYLTRHDSMRHNGIGRVYLNLKNGMERQGHKTGTVASNDNSAAQYLKYFMWDIRHKIPHDADVYHAMTPCEAIHLDKRKSVISMHDLIPVKYPDLSGSGLNSNLVNRVIGESAYNTAFKQAAKCAVVVATCQNLKDELVDYLKMPGYRVRVVRLGINQDLDYHPKKDGIPRIGYVGQLDRRKRVDLLIKTFKQSSFKGELVIAGSGVDEKMLKALAGDDKRIKFLGFIPDESLCDFYNSLDVFAFLSMAEGYGLPMIEAMKCKKPVITMADAVMPWEVKVRTSIMKDQKDLLEILNNDVNVVYRTLETLLFSNYEFAKLHDWEVTCAEYEKLYMEIARS